MADGEEINRAEISVTNECVFACYFCFMKKWRDMDETLNLTEQDMQFLLELFPDLKKIEVIGGEPLKHPRLAEIVNELVGVPKVTVTTNGYLLPEGQEGVDYIAQFPENTKFYMSLTSYHERNYAVRNRDMWEQAVVFEQTCQAAGRGNGFLYVGPDKVQKLDFIRGLGITGKVRFNDVYDLGGGADVEGAKEYTHNLSNRIFMGPNVQFYKTARDFSQGINPLDLTQLNPQT
jgi:organic radical activating enzyme